MHPSIRVVAWCGEEHPEHIEVARMVLGSDRLDAVGCSVDPRWSASWSLQTTKGWVTQALQVSVQGDGWSRQLQLNRDPGGRWDAITKVRGAAPWSLGEPGLDGSSNFESAVDCDLGLCPVTNTMPVLRMSLHGEQPAPTTELTMAWVEMPSLRVSAVIQAYRQVSRISSGGAVVRYEGRHRGYVAELTVDGDGVVVRYPGLARRLL